MAGAARLAVLGFLAALPAAGRAGEVSGAFVQPLAYTTGIATLTIDVDARRDDSASGGDSDSERKVYRGAIPFGSGSRDAMEFSLDMDKGLLFLDRNRNGNLKDDGPGVAANTNDERYFKFENLSAEAKIGKANVPYEFDLNCYVSSHHRFWRLAVKSGWQGVVELGGKRWTLGVMDDMDGVVDADDIFILRPAFQEAAATKEADTGCGSYSDRSDRVPATTNLSVNGQNFGLQFAWRGDRSSSVLDLTFVPASQACGTLEVESALVKRVLLEGPGVVVLDPPASARIPQGFYGSVTVYLGEEGKPAMYQSRLKPMRILADGTRRMKVGGTLQNVVTVSEQGAFLRLNYDLKGADSNSYQTLVWRSDARPAFSIRKDGKEVASGNFEYG